MTLEPGDMYTRSTPWRERNEFAIVLDKSSAIHWIPSIKYMYIRTNFDPSGHGWRKVS